MAVGGKGKGQLVKAAIKYGVRYGPVAFEAFKHGREPAQQAVQSVLARRNARKIAVEHAKTLREGTVLKVMRDGDPVWFVFSGDEIVATYPQVPMDSYGDLLRHTDLANRIRPEDMPQARTPATMLNKRRKR
jgi:hypothetical protein